MTATWTRRVATIACATMVGVIACAQLARAQDTEAKWKGKALPEVPLTLRDGKTLDAKQMAGKVVVLDLWATWCPPCRKGLPHVQELSANKALADQGLMVVAVNQGEAAEVVDPFLKQNSFTFPVAMDTEGKLGQALAIDGIPTTLVIGRDGKIANVFVGFGPDSPKMLDEAVNKALAVKAAS